MRSDPRNQLAAFMVSLAISFMLASPVLAQVAAQAAGGGVDFTPVANTMITTVGSALGVAATVVAGFLMQFLFAKAKLNDAQLEQLMASRLNDILLKAIDFGEAWMKAQVADPSSPIKHLTFNNLVLDVMARYAVASAPEIIAKFRLTDDRIKDMIKARIAPYLAPPKVDGGELKTITAIDVIPATV